jgi:hypothetical protein
MLRDKCEYIKLINATRKKLINRAVQHTHTLKETVNAIKMKATREACNFNSKERNNRTTRRADACRHTLTSHARRATAAAGKRIKTYCQSARCFSRLPCRPSRGQYAMQTRKLFCTKRWFFVYISRFFCFETILSFRFWLLPDPYFYSILCNAMQIEKFCRLLSRRLIYIDLYHWARRWQLQSVILRVVE